MTRRGQTVLPWQINRSETWPPSGRVTPPISPSLYEMLQKCQLQATFHASPGYPGRTFPKTRLGTAFHRALEQIWREIPKALEYSPKDFRWHGARIFREAVAEQQRESAQNFRELALEWDDDLITQMEIAIGLTAGRWLEEYRRYGSRPKNHQFSGETPIETMLKSRDGLLHGKPDRVILSRSGPVIIDYKTGPLHDAEMLERYERQLLFYACLWHDCHGVLPVEGRLVNAIEQQEHRLKIDPAAVADLAADARQLARSLGDMPSPFEQANVGEHCRWCTFRPWCEPFWQSQRAHITLDSAEQATPSWECLEGQVEAVETHGNEKNNVRHFFSLTVGQEIIEVSSDLQLHPHLSNLQPGDYVRVLDGMLTSAPDYSVMKLTPWSEGFRVVDI